jgi:hypothetical protein
MGLLWGVYQFSLSHSFGEIDLRKKHEEQFETGLGVLGGRSEFMYSLPAIADSPILGHGSWAKNPKYIQQAQSAGFGDLRREEGSENEFLIPTHSHVFGAWVEAGLLGALFWLRLWWLAAVSLLGAFKRGDPIWPLTALVASTLLWDLLFSPFGMHRRFVQAFNASVILFSIGYRRPSTERGPIILPDLLSQQAACLGQRVVFEGIHSITRRPS